MTQVQDVTGKAGQAGYRVLDTKNWDRDKGDSERENRKFSWSQNQGLGKKGAQLGRV